MICSNAFRISLAAFLLTTFSCKTEKADNRSTAATTSENNPAAADEGMKLDDDTVEDTFELSDGVPRTGFISTSGSIGGAVGGAIGSAVGGAVGGIVGGAASVSVTGGSITGSASGGAVGGASGSVGGVGGAVGGAASGSIAGSVGSNATGSSGGGAVSSSGPTGPHPTPGRSPAEFIFTLGKVTDSKATITIQKSRNTTSGKMKDAFTVCDTSSASVQCWDTKELAFSTKKPKVRFTVKRLSPATNYTFTKHYLSNTSPEDVSLDFQTTGSKK